MGWDFAPEYALVQRNLNLNENIYPTHPSIRDNQSLPAQAYRRICNEGAGSTPGFHSPH